MFRIHFNPVLGRFVIQVSQYGFFWTTIKCLNEKNDGIAENSFETYDASICHIKTIGLDKLYEDRSVNRYRAHMKGKGFERNTAADGTVIMEKFHVSKAN